MKTPVAKGTDREQTKRRDARTMLGFARRFRKTRTTAEWMAELRAGEGLITRNARDFETLFPDLAIFEP